MKANLFKWILRLWIGIASIATFIGGWSMLGHAAKPVSADSASTMADANTTMPDLVAPLPTLAPVPAFDGTSGTALQPFTRGQVVQQPSFQFSQPMFRSRGS